MFKTEKLKIKKKKKTEMKTISPPITPISISSPVLSPSTSLLPIPFPSGYLTPPPPTLPGYSTATPQLHFPDYSAAPRFP